MREARAVFLADLLAAGRSATTARPYGMDLLRRFRFSWVLRGFCEAQLEWDAGPLLNPFPLARPGRRPRGGSGPDAPVRRSGRYRSRVPRRIPRGIPEEVSNQVFAALGSDGDRALVAFYVSSGVRASELLGLRQGDLDVGRQALRAGTGVGWCAGGVTGRSGEGGTA